MGGFIADPFSKLIKGMLTGYDLGRQIRAENMAQEMHQRRLADIDAAGSARDIQTQMMLSENSRPVNAGTVAEDWNLPVRPTSVGPVGGYSGTMVRPADKSRTVKYKTREGVEGQYELLTPEEQMQKRISQAEAMSNVGTVELPMPEYMRAAGAPGSLRVGRNAVPSLLNTMGQMQPVATPQIAQEMGMPAQVPYRNLSAVTAAVGRGLTLKQQKDIADARLKQQKEIADDNRKSTEKRTAASNSTRLQAAQISAGGVENRFQRAAMTRDEGRLRDLQSKETAYHAEKLQIHELLKNPDMEDKQRKELDAKLPALDLKIKGTKTMRDGLMKKYGPTPDIAAKVPEGATVQGPNGWFWKKTGGQMQYVPQE